jgi:hypothetical protein
MDEIIAACVDCQALKAQYDHALANFTVHTLPREFSTKCAAHIGQYKSGRDDHRYSNGHEKLWAIVRSCSLTQCGHWMMGSIRIGSARITVSGPIGHDGLPLDVQSVPIDWRERLTLVPEDIAAIYWKSDGHNDVGATSADVLRQWARSATFIR